MKLLIGLSIIASGMLVTTSSYADLNRTTQSLNPIDLNGHKGETAVCPYKAAGCGPFDLACALTVQKQLAQSINGTSTR